LWPTLTSGVIRKELEVVLLAKHARSGWWEKLVEKAKDKRIRWGLLVLLFIGLFVVSYNYFTYQQGFRLTEQSELIEPEHRSAIEEEEETTDNTESQVETDTTQADLGPEKKSKETQAGLSVEQGEPKTQEATASTSPTREQLLGGMVWPVKGDILLKIGWHYSDVLREWRYHPGVDIAAASGTTVQAAVAGTVEKVELFEGFGATVVVGHRSGVKTVYSGLGEVAVNKGDAVESGQELGSIGLPPMGEKPPPHLHFELQLGGEPADPIEYLNK
jgi:murein DD-endopeptidase MepM/ murein hydrolase activator NlpD